MKSSNYLFRIKYNKPYPYDVNAFVLPQRPEFCHYPVLFLKMQVSIVYCRNIQNNQCLLNSIVNFSIQKWLQIFIFKWKIQQDHWWRCILMKSVENRQRSSDDFINLICVSSEKDQVLNVLQFQETKKQK